MSAAQWFILGVLATVGTFAFLGLLLEVAKDAIREHYRRAGVAYDRPRDFR